ncbi:MAG TPA: hypothetical protein VFE34_22570 [Dongiaceae bacterium]|jgi:hypothetical protein|nr:hypothetical protein [Dongiaceae bacterium]
MTNRLKLWAGVSALALASGVLPPPPVLSPITDLLGVNLASEALADESGEGEDAECTTGEDGEGDEGGTTECPSGDDSSSGEDGEGEG